MYRSPGPGRKTEKNQLLTLKLTETFHEAEDALSVAWNRVDNKKKLIAAKDKAIQDVENLEKLLEAYKKGKASLADVNQAVEIAKENQEAITRICSAVAAHSQNK